MVGRDSVLNELQQQGASLVYLEKLARIIRDRTCGGGSLIIDEMHAVDIADKLEQVALYWRGFHQGAISGGR